MPTIVETERRMRNRGRWLCRTGWALFAVSLTMPAFHVMGWLSGWECLRVVFDIMVHPWSAGIGQSAGGWLYYSGLAIANMLLIASPLYVWKFRNDLRWLRRGSILLTLATLHTASYFFLGISGGWQTIGDLHIGYYAWVLSFGLVTAGMLRLSMRRPRSMVNQLPDSIARTPQEIRAVRELEDYLQGIDRPRTNWQSAVQTRTEDA